MMTTPTYVISYGTDFADLAAHAFPTRDAAVAFADAAVDRSAYVVGAEEDITFDGCTLLHVFNALTGSGVKKFESRAVGVRRLFSVLPTVAKPAPAAQQEEKNVSETQTNEAPKRRGRARTSNKPISTKINPGGSRAKMIGLCDGHHTLGEIAQALETDVDTIKRRLGVLSRRKGIEHTVDDAGRPTLRFPEGKSFADYTVRTDAEAEAA